MTAIAPRTTVVKIYTGDYLYRIADLEARAKAAKEQAHLPRLNHEVPEYMKLAEEHDQLVREAEEAGVVLVRVQALGRKAWKELTAQHPPRKANDDGVSDDDAALDDRYGMNIEAIADPLVAASVIEPADLDMDSLADIDFDRVFWAAMGLNRGATPDPKASLVSLLTETSSQTSSRPSDSESPSGDTEDGSPVAP